MGLSTFSVKTSKKGQFFIFEKINFIKQNSFFFFKS